MTQVTATDADDPTYGNSARIVYSILHGQPYFSVDPKTGMWHAVLDAVRKLEEGVYFIPANTSNYYLKKKKKNISG